MTGNSQYDTNYDVFRDCVFSGVTEKLAPTSTKFARRRKSAKGNALPDTITVAETDPSELADFSNYISSEIFENLPSDLRLLTHQSLKKDVALSDKYSLPLTLTNLESITSSFPPSVSDTLIAYSLITPPYSDCLTFLLPILTTYISTATAAPPPPSSTRFLAPGCELCLRSWIPLTYHHLIPRSTHERVLKRGWHAESELQNVAWLCRACHSFVHRMASNEELAREWFTVERIEQREDVQAWVKWIGKVRWKKT